MTRYTTNRINAAPRSVLMTSKSTCDAAMIVVSTTSLNLVDFCKRAATKNTNVIFTSSEGCIPIPAILNPSFAPPDFPAKRKTTRRAKIPIPAYSHSQLERAFTFRTMTGTIRLRRTAPAATIHCFTALLNFNRVNMINPIENNIHMLFTINRDTFGYNFVYSTISAIKNTTSIPYNVNTFLSSVFRYITRYAIK